MFADAYEKASAFTHPVIVSVHHFDGTLHCSLAAFVVLNADGWALTAAHVLAAGPAFEQHREEIAEHARRVDAVSRDSRLSAKQKRQKSRRIKSNPKWITDYSFWWGWDGLRSREVIAFPKSQQAVDLTFGAPSPISEQQLTELHLRLAGDEP